MKLFNIFVFFLFFANTIVKAQTTNFQKEINEQVWKQFIASFNARDDEGFSKVHSKDIVRVNQDGAMLQNFTEYFKPVPDSIKNRINDWSRNIELRFIQRIASEINAFEVGYYKTTSTNSKTGETRKYFGKFHVLHKKENGTWKILMDADTSEGILEEMFDKANPLEKI